jgi:predicted glutamine amidotransferase
LGRPLGEEEVSKSIDTICDRLRIQLHGIDRRLEALKGNGMATSEKSRRKMESQADAVQQRIFDRRRTVENANTNVNAWVKSKRAGSNAEVDQWKERRQVLQLNSRADYAEEYAVASFELVMAATDKASAAALEALLARTDANVAALPASPNVREA